MSTKPKSLRPFSDEEAPSAVRSSGVRDAHRDPSKSRVFVERRGRGTDVVLLHGAVMAPAHLRHLAERLSSRFRVLSVHRPGYGSSDAVRPYDAETSLSRIEDALVTEGVQRPFLVGLSVGAQQCMALAVRGRIDARGLVVVGAPRYGGEARRAARAIARTLRAGGDVRTAVADRMLGPSAASDVRFVSEVRSWLLPGGQHDLADELVAVADELADHRLDVAALGIPALLRLGTADRMGPPDYLRSSRELMQDARIEEVPAAGHALLLEDYEPTAASVEHFLLEHTRGLSL